MIRKIIAGIVCILGILVCIAGPHSQIFSWLAVFVELANVLLGLIFIFIAAIIYYPKTFSPAISPGLFITNILFSLSAMITIFALTLIYLQIPAPNNILIRAMYGITLIVGFLWKMYFSLSLIISFTSLALILKRYSQFKTNILYKLQLETSLFASAIIIALAIAFILSMRKTSTGKPDLEFGIFISYLIYTMLSYLIIRIGVGCLSWFRNR